MKITTNSKARAQRSDTTDADGATREITLADVLQELRQIRTVLASGQAELLTAKQAARLLGISVASLYRLAAANAKLKPITVGHGSKRWRRADLQRYVAECR